MAKKCKKYQCSESIDLPQKIINLFNIFVVFFQEKTDKTKPIHEHVKTNAGHRQDDQHAISTQNQLMRIAEGLSNESLYKHPILVFTDVNPLFMQQECFFIKLFIDPFAHRIYLNLSL